MGKTIITTPKKKQTDVGEAFVRISWTTSRNSYFFIWAIAFQVFALYRPVAWWRALYLDLHEKSLWNLVLKLCWLNSDLWLVTEAHSSLRSIMVRILSGTKNHFCNVWQKEARTQYHLAFPYDFYRNHSNTRLKISEQPPFPDVCTTLTGKIWDRDLWEIPAPLSLCGCTYTGSTL